jgi:hypothetical protein
VFPEAEVEEQQADPEEQCGGLEALPVPELRERGRVLGVVPVGTDRGALHRAPEPWVEALRAAREAAQSTAAVVAAATPAATATCSGSVCTRTAVATAHAVRTSQPRARKPETHGFDGWQQGVRADGRDGGIISYQVNALRLLRQGR